MLGKILLLPFWILKKVLDLLFGTVKFVGFRFFGVLIGAVLGFFLGKAYLEKKARDGSDARNINL